MARTAAQTTFEAPNGRTYWIRRVPPKKRLPGIAGAWPPDGWICAPDGEERILNATRPTIADAIAHATGIGMDQPWITRTAQELEEKVGAGASR